MVNCIAVDRSLIIDHWSLVCGEIVNNKNSHTSQPTTNNREPSRISAIKKVLGYLTEGSCGKFPQGKRIQDNLTGFKESAIFSVVYVLFINRFKLLGFNWLIKLPWQLRCPQTEQKSQQSLIFSSQAYALISRGKRLRRSRAYIAGFQCHSIQKRSK